jgi:release factor glutamine methyltransferase
MMQGEPLQYVLGSGWFMGMKLRITPAALIPRPETEELVRLVLEKNSLAAPAILDVGTGSGCIAIALKKHLPEASLTAVDISEKALLLAENNANSLEVNVQFKTADILKNNDLGKFDIIVSNPPYIPVSEAATMANHVTEHEPHLALFTENDDPLVFYRRLMELTPTMLRPGGCVCCEIHENLADDLLVLAQHYPIQTPEIHRDLQAKNRMIFWRAQ